MTLMTTYYPGASSSILFGELAGRVAEVFERPEICKGETIALRNAFRLLEMFRYDAFAGVHSPGILDLDATSFGTDPGDSDEQVVKQAMMGAANSVYPGVDKDAVVETLEQVISAMAKDEPVATYHSQLGNAKTFFAEVSKALQV